jgi:hypothetical protein
MYKQPAFAELGAVVRNVSRWAWAINHKASSQRAYRTTL